MRMIIDSGNIESKDFSEVKSTVGASGLKDLMSKVVDFYNINRQSKDIKSSLDAIKSSITEVMSSLEIDKIEHKGIKCTLAKRENKSVNEQGLLDFCKSLNIDGLVKTVEVVDMDVLENLIYTKQLDADSVSKYFTITESVFPKISGKFIES